MMEIETFLRKIIASLNCVEVKGKENMDYLLGVIIAIEGVINQMNAPENAAGKTENQFGSEEKGEADA